MQRSAPIRLLVLGVVVSGWLVLGLAYDNHCHTNPFKGTIVCDVSGNISGDEPVAQPIKQPRPAPPPLRYLRVTAGCYAWYPDAPGLDTWNVANEQAMLNIITGTPRCVGEPLPDRAWRIFRSFPLAEPDPTLLPEEHGITGLPTLVTTTEPGVITHSETLPSGILLEVRALVATLTVDWGDGYITRNTRAHTYTTKTCPPDYRITHPSGGLCHPTLDAYPITATFTWWGEYRIGGAWIPIGTLDLATTVAYDVDEVIGVLVDP